MKHLCNDLTLEHLRDIKNERAFERFFTAAEGLYELYQIGNLLQLLKRVVAVQEKMMGTVKGEEEK